MAEQIPTRVRLLVNRRSGGMCERCGATGTELSHRRPRGVGGDHRNCPCNLMRSCRECHQGYAHRFPTQALREGWTLPRATEFPGAVPVMRFDYDLIPPFQWVLLDCQGGVDLAASPEGL